MYVHKKSFRWSLVSEARRRIRAGAYEDDGIIDQILAKSGPNSLRWDLDHCPVGDGEKYRDLVALTLVSTLRGSIDIPLMRKEFPVSSGRGDIDLPFRLHALEAVPLLRRWQGIYNTCAILVETKNQKRKSCLEDVRQILDYLNRYALGHVGFLISRSGFSFNAGERLSQIVREINILIIPLDHEELLSLVNCTTEQAFSFFYRKEIMLRQAGRLAG